MWDPTRTKWAEGNTNGLWTCDFIQTTLRLTKGARRGDLVELRHWQGDLLCDVLRLNASGRRMYRTYLLMVARKNSKSMLGAGLALDGLFDEQGAEVYSCGGDKEQAKLVFGEVKTAVELSPDLSKILKTYRDAIEFPQFGSVYRATSSDAKLKEGLNPSRVLFDELHVQRDDDLWNVMNQGSGTRDQPLVIAMSTKGVVNYSDGTPTICKRTYDDAVKVQSGELDDPSFGSRIYEATGQDKPGFDYRDEKNWAAPNPALGDFLHVEDMRTRAVRMPEADFMTKRMNIWVAFVKAWLPSGALERLSRPRRPFEESEQTVLALDGSYSQDSTALIMWRLGGLKPHLQLLGLWERPVDADQLWRVPVAEVETLIVDTCRGLPIDPDNLAGDRHPPAVQVAEVVFDLARWQRTASVLEQDWGLPVTAFPQSAERMVPATTSFYEAVMEQAFTHDGDPALLRHFANATTKFTQRGTMIDKRNQRAKIDVASASIFGYDRARALLAEHDASYEFVGFDALQELAGSTQGSST